MSARSSKCVSNLFDVVVRRLTNSKSCIIHRLPTHEETEARPIECSLAMVAMVQRDIPHSMHNAAWLISKHFVSRSDRDIPRYSLIIFAFAILGGGIDLFTMRFLICIDD